MAEEWTSDELLVAIRDKGRIPDDDPDATDAKLLSLANDQMKTRFVPAIRSARGEWYVDYEDQDLEAGVSGYRIPWRASTASVRTVLWYDSSGRRFECTPVPMGDQHAGASRRGRPSWYTIEDDKVRLIPTPASAMGTLRIYYERRPSSLILEAAAVQIAFIYRTGGVVRLASATNPTPLIGGYLVDLVRYRPPFSLGWKGQTISAIAGPALGIYTIDFVDAAGTEATPDNGDWLCREGESVIPQIPPEFHPLLAQATAAQYLQPIDPEAYATMMADFQDRFETEKKLLTPRNQGRQQKMRGSSLLRRGASRRGGTFDDFGG